jgi:hypothetical protein
MSVLIDVVFWTFTVVCAVCLVHAPIFAAASRWHGQNAGLVFSDYGRYASRRAAPPWYVRYSTWVLRL